MKELLFLLIDFNPSRRRAVGTCKRWSVYQIRGSHWITSINGTIYPVTFCGDPSSRALVNPTSRCTSTISRFVRRSAVTTARLRGRRNHGRRQDEIASLCAGEMFAVGSCVIHRSEERPETECEIVRHAEQSAGRSTRSLRYIAVSLRM